MRREIEHRLSFFETWLRNQRYSEKTIVTYVKAIKIFFQFFKSKLPEQITISDFHSFNKDFIIKQGYSASYQNQVINAIKLFYLKIEQRELNIELIERPRKYRPLPKVIPKEVIQRMLTSIPNLKHQTALTLIYSCGLRRSELINLKLCHLDSKRRTLSVINGKGQKDRVLPVSEKMMQIIIKYYKMYKPTVYLIEGQVKGQKYSETSLENIFHKYLGMIYKDHKFTLHCLRHSYATHLLESGVNLRYIQELLGHKSSKTTEIYTHVSTHSLSTIRNPIDDFDL
ncbi:MAG TPA: tyrosine-type recombinase/integrase [Bacteroidales bacterium]|nr:tyrosine-type recombinase/integrase [Bacteroidales bacterium]